MFGPSVSLELASPEIQKKKPGRMSEYLNMVSKFEENIFMVFKCL